MNGVARTSLRVFGLLCLALAVWMYMPRRPAAPPAAPVEPPARLCEAYPGGFADATLAIEFARTPADVDCIVSLARPGSIARGLRWDRFVIALYWSILTCLGLLFLRSGGHRRQEPWRHLLPLLRQSLCNERQV